jgi:hypothetical protein
VAHRAPEEIAAERVSGAEGFLRDIVAPCRPVILRGLVADWPAVEAGRTAAAFRAYLAEFDVGRQAEVFVGAPQISGKYYYSDDLAGFNFERRAMRLSEALDAIVSSLGVAGAPSMYVGSLPTEDYLPGFAGQNSAPLPTAAAGPRIWLGHASNVSCHYDTVDNLACVVAGKRRFTLYAPELIGSLYAGPIDHTLAGPPVSLAASEARDDVRYPKFSAVSDQALVAELEPGDALYLPKLWWHGVEATAPFNCLVNYWWDAFAAGPDAPYTTLLLAMIAICERPEPERRAWRALFDHYVFRPNGHPLAHLPAERHGLLGPLKAGNYGRLRARILHLLRGG